MEVHPLLSVTVMVYGPAGNESTKVLPLIPPVEGDGPVITKDKLGTPPFTVKFNIPVESPAHRILVGTTLRVSAGGELIVILMFVSHPLLSVTTKI